MSIRSTTGLGACALILGLVAACDGEAPDPSPSRAAPVRVSLQPPADAREPPARAKFTRRYEADPDAEQGDLDLAALRVVGGESERVRIKTRQIPELTEGVELADVRQVRLRMPGPFDGPTTDVIEILLSAKDPAQVFLQAIVYFGDEEIVSEATSARVTRRISTETIDLSMLERLDEPVDRIELQLSTVANVTPEPPIVRLYSIRLRDRPRRQWLPGLGQEELVAIGNERRPAYGLSERHPLSGELSVTEQTRLTFSYGIPEVLLVRSTNATVRVRLESATKTVERDFQTKTFFDRGVHWRTGSLALDEFQNTALKVSFELVGESDKQLYCAIGNLEAWSPVASPPTVLLVTSDTHRSDYVGPATRGADVRTPTIDALAADGVFFEDVYSSANITNPSHIALMTGIHPRDTRIVSNERRLAEEAKTLAEVFRDRGFATFASVSVRHLDAEWSGLGQGFDRMAGPVEIERTAKETIDDLEGWLKDAEGRPLFAWLHVFDAHDPYEPEEAYADLYYPRGRDPKDPNLPTADPGLEVRHFPGYIDTEYFEAMYRGEITYLDAELGKLLSRARFRDAIIGLTSDHGENLHEGVETYGHRGLSHNTLSVPLVLRYPGAPAGTRIGGPVRQMDLGRTLLDLAGLKDVEFEGRNLLEERPSAPRFAMEDNYVGASIQLGNWMLVMPLKPAPVYGIFEESVHRPFLYDHERDPSHTEDVSADHPEVTRRLRAALVDWLASARSLELTEEPAGNSAQRAADLQQLGYATGEAPTSSEWIDPECDCDSCESYR